MSVSEEHTVLRWDGPPPAIGSTIAFRPTQVRTTFNLHDTVLLWNGETYQYCHVDARGASR